MKAGIRSTRVVMPGGIRPAVVVIDGATIESVLALDAVPADLSVEDVGDDVVMAGLVDCHVHINEPGRTEWEGFETATRAAAAGGITTVVDMPLNCTPVTTTVDALEVKLRETRGKLWVDVGFWGGVVPGNSGDLAPMGRAGVLGCKAFLCHSGIDDFPNVGREDLRLAMEEMVRAGLPLLAHAELDLGAPPSDLDARTYESYLASRPRSWEDSAIAMLIELCRETGCAVHIVHLSSASSIPQLRDARAEGLPITVETCPHYLCLAAEEIPDGNTTYKCAPPIRERENCEALWKGLDEGVIDFVISDHSPCTPHLKCLDAGDFHAAWGGIASLQFGLPNIWTEARRRGFGLERLVEWMSREPARFAGLDARKGQLAPGYDADIVVWCPDEKFTIEADAIHFRHKISPYLGREVYGRISRTWLRGELVYRGDTFAESPRGEHLLGRQPLDSHMRVTDELNGLSAEAAFDVFQRCCGATRWVEGMVSRRPFANWERLCSVADELWAAMERQDILEAFEHHPRIGADLDKLREKFAATSGWSAGEQSGVTEATEEAIRELRDGNITYEERFGHIFIVCATGKSAAQMLGLLEERLSNDPATELKIAAGEQAKITRIRLEKLAT